MLNLAAKDNVFYKFIKIKVCRSHIIKELRGAQTCTFTKLS